MYVNTYVYMYIYVYTHYIHILRLEDPRVDTTFPKHFKARSFLEEYGPEGGLPGATASLQGSFSKVFRIPNLRDRWVNEDVWHIYIYTYIYIYSYNYTYIYIHT